MRGPGGDIGDDLMRTGLIATALLCLTFALPAAADSERFSVGTARLFTNDFFGDGKDRWRTGSYQVSHFRARGFDGTLPGRAGEVLEFRLRSEIIAAERLSAPEPGDRRYAGVLGFGIHTPFQTGGWETSIGVDVLATGPQTGIGSFQATVHEWLDASEPDLDDQIENGIHPTLIASATRPLTFGDTRVRPFVEMQAGLETFGRAGVDVLIGSYGAGGLLARDATTGVPMRADHRQAAGFSFLLGGDYTVVEHSRLLPADDGYVVKDRSRVRAGVQWADDQQRIFYGLTYLSEEFEAQREGQIVGSLTVDFAF